MKYRLFKDETLIDATLEDAFDFFCKAENLERLTPDFLQFKIVTPLPVEMREGQIIDYKLKIHGISVKWQSVISEWNPPNGFVDKQIKGPYRLWIHRHTFESLGSRTRMVDEVKYLSPGFILEPIINKLFVEKDIRKIFDYRKREMSKIFKIVENDDEPTLRARIAG